MQFNTESSRRVNSSTDVGLCGFDVDKTREISQGSEPSTDNITNTMTEGTHRVNNMSSGLPNLIGQRKTRVSELSIIDLNDPLPSKCAHPALDCNPEGKIADDKLQETKQQYRQGKGQKVVDKDNWQQQQQGRNSGKGRHNDIAGLTRKQTQAGQERENTYEKAGPSQYYNKRKKENATGSVGQRHFVGK